MVRTRKAQRKDRTFTVAMPWGVYGLLAGLAQVIPAAAERGNVSATVRGLVVAEAERRGITGRNSQRAEVGHE